MSINYTATQNECIVIGSHARGEVSPKGVYYSEEEQYGSIAPDSTYTNNGITFIDSEDTRYQVGTLDHPEILLDAYTTNPIQSALLINAKQKLVKEHKGRTLQDLRKSFKYHIRVMESGKDPNGRRKGQVHIVREDDSLLPTQAVMSMDGSSSVKSGYLRPLQLGFLRRLIVSAPEFFDDPNQKTGIHHKIKFLFDKGLITPEYAIRIGDIYNKVLCIYSAHKQDLLYSGKESLTFNLSESDQVTLLEAEELIREIDANQTKIGSTEDIQALVIEA